MFRDSSQKLQPRTCRPQCYGMDEMRREVNAKFMQVTCDMRDIHWDHRESHELVAPSNMVLMT